jgi:hypothetical protein
MLLPVGFKGFAIHTGCLSDLTCGLLSGVLVVEGDADTTPSVFIEGSHAYVYVVFNGVNPGSSERVIGEVFQGYSFTVIESSGGFNASLRRDNP